MDKSRATAILEVLQRILILTNLLRKTAHPVAGRELLHQLDQLIEAMEEQEDSGDSDHEVCG